LIIKKGGISPYRKKIITEFLIFEAVSYFENTLTAPLITAIVC
jgi:hypothetical protein